MLDLVWTIAVVAHWTCAIRGFRHARDDEAQSTVQYAVIFGTSLLIPTATLVLYVMAAARNGMRGAADASIILWLFLTLSIIFHAAALPCEWFLVRDRQLRRVLQAGLCASGVGWLAVAQRFPTV